MANYTQWRAHADKGEVRRITFVCGDQLVLVEDVVDTIRTLVAASVLDTATFHAGQTPDAFIWDAAFQYPMVRGASRLIIVRDAQQMTDWQPLHAWMGMTRRLPGVHLVFVSTDADLPRTDGELAAHIEAMKAPRGHLVRCTAPNETDMVDFVRAQVSMSADTARHLVARTGGDLTAAAWVCRKLALFEHPAGRTAIDALADPGPADQFADSLLADRKPDALMHIPDLDGHELLRVFGLLDSRLDTLAALWRAAVAGQSAREITAVPAFLVRTYQRLATAYSPDRCARNRTVLALLDDVVRGGTHDGVPEALVALW